MANRFVIFAVVQAIFVQSTFSQCVNRYAPSCGCSNILPTETILPNQVLLNQNQLINPRPCINQLPAFEAVQTVIPNQVPTTTIIQDSTVANNLANALQLLVVSNLLSNTLPSYAAPVELVSGYGAPIDVFPGYGAPIEMIPGYGAPIEFVPQLAPAPSSCGCGLGGYNFLY